MSKQLSTFLLLTFVAALLLLPLDAYVENSDKDKAALLLSPVDAIVQHRGGGSNNNKKKKKKKKQRRRRKKKKNQKKKSSSSSSSSSGFNQGRINRKYEDLTAYELLEYLTDTTGPNKGFRILLQLIDAADIQDEVDGLLQDFTLFAPNDQAFCRTATNDLGYKGGCNPPDADDVLEYYVDVLSDLAGDDEAVLGEIVVGILTYHVADGRMSVQDLRRKGHFGTLCDCNDIEVKKVSKRKTKLYDAASKYPNIEFRQQNMAVEDDGMVHVIKGVLLPSFDDIPDVCPPGGGDACFFAPENQHRCGDCSYPTVCDLEAAGFDRDDDCCQQPPSDTFCTDEYKPVACGDKGCEYDNFCFASTSGYNRRQCENLFGVKCPKKEPDSGSRCNRNQEGLSCNLGDEYDGDRYCWKDCIDGVWAHLCAVDDADGGGGGGGGGGDKNIILGGGQKFEPFQCSSIKACVSCLGHPSCDGWAGGCYSTCSYDGNDPQSFKAADASCYDSSNGGCEAARTGEMNYRTCSEQTTCNGCTSTKKYGGGSCLWFSDDSSYVGGGFCRGSQGMLYDPIDECPEVSIAF